MGKYGRAGQATDDNVMLRRKEALCVCWVTKALIQTDRQTDTHTHNIYVILTTSYLINSVSRQHKNWETAQRLICTISRSVYPDFRRFVSVQLLYVICKQMQIIWNMISFKKWYYNLQSSVAC